MPVRSLPCLHICLNRPNQGKQLVGATKGILLREMIHIDHRVTGAEAIPGVKWKSCHENEAWRRDIERFHWMLTGEDIYCAPNRLIRPKKGEEHFNAYWDADDRLVEDRRVVALKEYGAWSPALGGFDWGR